MALDATLRHDIIEFLTPLPLFENERTRRAMLLDAGFETITRTFDLSGNPAQSVSLLIEHIYQCGGMPALAQFVEKVGAKLGKDQREKADGFCERLRRAAAPTAAAPIAPDMLRFQEPVLNLEKECAAFRRILSGDDAQTRLILIHGQSGMSKSHLLGLYEQLARQANPLLCDFKKEESNVESFLFRVICHAGGAAHFANYRAAQLAAAQLVGEGKWRILAEHFFLDLAQHHAIPPLILLLDTFERAEAAFRKWLTQIFLPSLAHQNRLTVALAGQDEIAPPATLRGACLRFHLTGVPLEKYHAYLQECRLQLEPEKVAFAHQVLQGQPSGFVSYINSLQPQEARHVG